MNNIFEIGIIESKREVIINLSWILWEINLKGRRVRSKRNIFRKPFVVFSPPLFKYFSTMVWISINDTIEINKSILFQLSLKYEPSSRINPKAIILIIISNKKAILKKRSHISKIKTEVYPDINVFNIRRTVDKKIRIRMK